MKIYFNVFVIGFKVRLLMTPAILFIGPRLDSASNDQPVSGDTGWPQQSWGKKSKKYV